MKMRYLWAIVCTLLISASTPGLSGGMSGGTGIGGLVEEIIDEIQAILHLPIEIDSATIRRIIMRLCTYGEAEIKIGNKTFKVKWKAVHDWSDGNIEVIEVGVSAS